MANPSEVTRRVADSAGRASPMRAIARIGGLILNGLTALIFYLLRLVYGLLGVKVHASNAECPVSVYTVRPGADDTAPIYFSSGAFVLLFNDFWLILKQAWTIPLIPFPPARFGVSGTADVSWFGTLAQIVLIATSIAITIFSVSTPVFMVLYFPLLWVYFYVLRKLDGPDTIHSRPPVSPGDSEKFKNEAWLCVNGIATSKGGLQLIIDYLHKRFGRPVTGIYNQTFGIWYDLVECMMQRDLLWPTEDVNLGYKVLSDKIRNPTLKRVVLVAHSQGGIITSIWADQLLVDFAADDESRALLKKLEIYTFASAANHFSSADAFGHVEHFWNTLDFVSRIGVGHFAPFTGAARGTDTKGTPVVKGRFEGTVFKRVGAAGHLLLSEYFGEGQSILDNPAVKDNSWLERYVAGGAPT